MRKRERERKKLKELKGRKGKGENLGSIHGVVDYD